MKTILLIAVIALTGISCKKSSDDSAALIKENLVGVYLQTDLLISNGGPAVSVWASFSCRHDDKTELKSNNTYVVTDAGTVCSPTTTDAGNWSISGNTFILDGDSYNVDSFDGKNIALTYTDPMGSKQTVKFSKQ